MKRDKRGKRLKCVLNSLWSYWLGKKNGSQAYSCRAEAWEIILWEICPDQLDKPKDITHYGREGRFPHRTGSVGEVLSSGASLEFWELPKQLPGDSLLNRSRQSRITRYLRKSSNMKDRPKQTNIREATWRKQVLQGTENIIIFKRVRENTVSIKQKKKCFDKKFRHEKLKRMSGK